MPLLRTPSGSGIAFIDRMKPEALIFDLNGTMVDDMGFHLKAWYEILNDHLKAGLSREEVKRQMYGKNEDLLNRVFGEGKFSPEEMDHWSVEKEKIYQRIYRPELRLIPGLDAFLQKAFEKKIPIAIGTAAIPFNIDFVLDQLGIRKYFSSIVHAGSVVRSKPDPETFLMAAGEIKKDPAACVVFEDAPKGVEAALRAGMHCVVITTMHEPAEFTPSPQILGFIKDYTDPFLSSLI